MAIDIGPILKQTGTALERKAADMFGNAVADFARNSLGGTLGVNHTATRETRQPGRSATRPQGATFVPSSYAAALAGGTDYRPKLKFLFKVEFVFTPEAVAAYPDVLGGTKSNDFTFMVKTVDRPKIDFEYEDDVNMYNFRTKVLKRIRHRELTVTFLDDVGNRVINFFRAMMMIQSPITRRQLLREGTTAIPNAHMILNGSGMEFSESGSTSASSDNAIRGVVNSQFGNVIQAVRIKQIYSDPSEYDFMSVKETIYDFMNVRIVSFDLDDLSHDLSEASTITMQFDYDWMEIVDAGSLSVMDGPHYSVDVPGSSAPVDMDVAKGDGRANVSSGGFSPFASILGGMAGNITTKISSDFVNKAVRNIAGNGLFGSVIGNYASNAVSGIIGGATRDLATGASLVLSRGASDIASGIIRDSGLGGIATRAVGVVRSTGDQLGNFISNLG